MTLQRQEIRLLLQQLLSGTLPRPRDERNQVAVPYDLGVAERITRGRLPGLEAVADRFSKAFRSALSSHLRHPVQVEFLGLEQSKLHRFTNGLPVPTMMYLFKLAPLRAFGCLVFSSEFVSQVVEASFGGKGMRPAIRERSEFSSIEQRLLSAVGEVALEQLNAAWAPTHAVTHQFSSLESNPLALSICQPSEDIYNLRFSIELLRTSAIVSVCLPASSLEVVRNKLRTGLQAPPTGRKIGSGLQAASVSVAVELGRGTIQVRELLTLSAGSTLMLETAATQPAVLKVEGIPKFSGSLGEISGRRAFRVRQRLENS